MRLECLQGEAISLLTPPPHARGWPSLDHRSAMRTHPHTTVYRWTLIDLIITTPCLKLWQSLKGGKGFFLISTNNKWVRWGQETRELKVTLSEKQKNKGLTQSHKKHPFHFSYHLCEIFAGLALILVAAGMEVAGDGWDTQVELAVLDKDVLQVVAPHGPGLNQDVVHLHRCWKGLVGLLWPEMRRWRALESEGVDCGVVKGKWQRVGGMERR